MKNISNKDFVDIKKVGNTSDDKLVKLVEKEQIAIRTYQSQNLDNQLRGTNKVRSVSLDIKEFIKAEFSKLKKH